jgi:hypothetical protein
MPTTGPSTPISKQLAALPDAQMRLRRLARWLAEAEPDDATLILEQAAIGCHAGVLWRLVHLTFVHLLLHIRPKPALPGGPLPMPDRQWLLPDVRVAALIGAAHRQGLPFTARLLRDAFTIPPLAEGELLALHPSVEKIPLGTRRQRARQADRAWLGQLLLDTTPSVVVLLAENPRIVEAQALQIASLRPTHSHAVQALLMSLRWLTNDKVCEALLRNSSTPPWLVLALVPLASRKVQLSVVHLLWLDPSIRALLAQWLGVDAGTMLAPRDYGDAPGLDVYEVDDDQLRPGDGADDTD